MNSPIVIDEQAELAHDRVKYAFLREDLKRLLPMLEDNKGADKFIRVTIAAIIGDEATPNSGDWVGTAQFVVDTLDMDNPHHKELHQHCYRVFSVNDALYGTHGVMTKVDQEELKNYFGVPEVLFDSGTRATPFLPEPNIMYKRVVDVRNLSGVLAVMHLLQNNHVPKDAPVVVFEVYRYALTFCRVIASYMKP